VKRRLQPRTEVSSPNETIQGLSEDIGRFKEAVECYRTISGDEGRYRDVTVPSDPGLSPSTLMRQKSDRFSFLP